MSCPWQGLKIYCLMRKLIKATTPKSNVNFNTFTTKKLSKKQQQKIKGGDGDDGIIVTDDLIIG